MNTQVDLTAQTTTRSARTLASVRPYLPGIREFILPLGLLAVLLVSNHASAGGTPTIDTAVGSNLTSNWKSIILSIQSSLVLKLLCAAVIVWGILKYIPTRKDGIGQIIAGIVGFLILSKLTDVLSVFGITFS